MDIPSLRTQFPVTGHWAFFDHGAVAPLPAPTRDALRDYADDLARHGVVSFLRWYERLHAVRAACGRLLNADPLDIAFVANTSTGIGFVAEGYPWQPGDNVVIAEDEYPANQYPWMNLHDRGVEVRRVPSVGSRILLDDIRARMDARTRIVSLSWVEFASGFRNDLDRIGEMCRDNGSLFCVDAIQGLGVLPIDVARQPIDFLSADGHKWLLGPEGAGVFYIRRELLDRLHPRGIGWNSVIGAVQFSTIDFRLKPHAGRYEGGTYNIPGIVAMGASIELLLDVGIAAIADRVKMLTDYLVEGCRRLGMDVFSSREADEWSGIVSLKHPSVEPKVLMDRCRQAGVIVNVRGGRLRVCPHFYNTTEEIDRLLAAIESPAPDSGVG